MQAIKPTLKGIIFTGLFVIPFIPFLVSSQFFFPFITPKAFAFRTIVEIIFAAWLLLALLEPHYRPKKSLILYALGAFLLIIALADIFGVAPVKSFWSNFERMEGYITLLHLGAFFVVIGSVFNEINWKYWWNVSLIASGIMAFQALFQVFGGDTYAGGVRVSGTIGNASYLAVYMFFHIFIAIYMLLKEKKGSFAKWAYAALILLQTYILYHTSTRGAVLGLMGGLIVLALLNIRNKEDKKLRRMSAAILVSIVVLVGGFLALRNTELVKGNPLLARFAQISTEEIKSGGRSFVWPMALKGIKDRPILGWGQDNFNYIFNTYYDPAMYNLEPWFDRAHNIFLDWGVAGGILGLLSYLSLYVMVLYLLWRSNGSNNNAQFSHMERSALTALVTAYFIHNFFVFDHLLSYILFFSLLAFVHGRSSTKVLGGENIAKSSLVNTTLPVLVVALMAVIYFGNIRPMVANTSLINALENVQASGDLSPAADHFKKAYGTSRLGRPETVEQIIVNSERILNSSMPMEKKNEYFQFAKGAVLKQAEGFSRDARYQLMAGSFFSLVGETQEAITHTSRAKELMPGKQAVYFELGNAYLTLGDKSKALAEFKKAYDMAPNYTEAKIIYLIGAIYSQERSIESKLLAEIPTNTIASDSRIVSAYLGNNRFGEVIAVLTSRLEANPKDPQAYVALAGAYMRTGQVSMSVEVLNQLGRALPEYKSQADELIRQIQSGEIK